MSVRAASRQSKGEGDEDWGDSDEWEYEYYYEDEEEEEEETHAATATSASATAEQTKATEEVRVVPIVTVDQPLKKERVIPIQVEEMNKNGLQIPGSESRPLSRYYKCVV